MRQISFIGLMSVQDLEEYLNDKYDRFNGIHHYEITKTSGDTIEVINIERTKLHNNGIQQVLVIINMKRTYKFKEVK